MLKMRLQRIGRKNNPTYRVLVVDSRQGPKSGSYVDILGTYDPKAGAISIDAEKARAWLGKGVQASGTVHNMLVSQKIIEGKKINVLPRKTPQKGEGTDAEQAPVAPEAAPEATPEAEPVPTEAAPEVEKEVSEESSVESTPETEEVKA